METSYKLVWIVETENLLKKIQSFQGKKKMK